MWLSDESSNLNPPEELKVEIESKTQCKTQSFWTPCNLPEEEKKQYLRSY